jgi:hypothetical protein
MGGINSLARMPLLGHPPTLTTCDFKQAFRATFISGEAHVEMPISSRTGKQEIARGW